MIIKSLVLLAFYISIAFAADNEECDCKIWPFNPDPPCFDMCYPIVASEASAEALVSIGLEPELAEKISELDSHKSTPKLENMLGAVVYDDSGSGIGTVEGFGILDNDERFIVREFDSIFVSSDTNKVLFLPVAKTYGVFNGVEFQGSAMEAQEVGEVRLEGFREVPEGSVEGENILSRFGVMSGFSVLTYSEQSNIEESFRKINEKDFELLMESAEK